MNEDEVAPAKNYRNGGDEGRGKPKDAWRTPVELYQKLNTEFRFDVDAACETANALASYGLCVDQGIDAFLADWGPPGSVVWCNPPYSNLRPWIDRAMVQSRTRTVVMLIPSDTSTRYWSEVVATRATQVRFLIGRPRFRTPSGDLHLTKRGGGGITTPCAIVVFTAAGGPPSYTYVERK